MKLLEAPLRILDLTGVSRGSRIFMSDHINLVDLLILLSSILTCNNYLAIGSTFYQNEPKDLN